MKPFALFLLIVCFPLGANARAVGFVSFDELRGKADLIVIATPIEVKEIAEHDPMPDFMPGDIRSAIETSFKIWTVLKGDITLKEFTLHHLSYNSFTRPMTNGPSIVSFDPKKNKKYLLFLKRESDGRYITVWGQVDPQISIREIKNEFYDAQ